MAIRSVAHSWKTSNKSILRGKEDFRYIRKHKIYKDIIIKQYHWVGCDLCNLWWHAKCHLHTQTIMRSSIHSMVMSVKHTLKSMPMYIKTRTILASSHSVMITFMSKHLKTLWWLSLHSSVPLNRHRVDNFNRPKSDFVLVWCPHFDHVKLALVKLIVTAFNATSHLHPTHTHN